MNFQKFETEYTNFVIKNRDYIREHLGIHSIDIELKTPIYLTIRNDMNVHYHSEKLTQSYNSLILTYLQTIKLFCKYRSVSNPLHMYKVEINYDEVLNEVKRIVNQHLIRNRSKVTSRWYNHFLGEFQLELEDGTFISESGKSGNLIDVDFSVFPKAFLAILNFTQFRELKIEQVI